jgi:type I restriction enzyme S subunit
VTSPWPIVELGDLCRITIGKTPPRAHAAYWSGGEHPWLSIADMNQGRVLTHTAESITDVAIQNLKCRLVQPGTVLLSFKLSIGKVGVAGVPMYTNEAIAHLPIRDPEAVESDYLYWALRSIPLVRHADRAAMGSTLNKDSLSRIPVPVPPVPKQRRIVTALDMADDLRARRRTTANDLALLPESMFIELFRKHGWDGWPTRTVEQLAAQGKGSIRTGPFGSQLLHSEFVDEGIHVLGIDNAVNNEFRWGEPRFITQEKYKGLARFTVRGGDVLITIMGTCGRVAVVPSDIPTAINTKHLCCVTLDHDQMLPEFLQACLLFHPQVRRQLGAKARGAVMPGLNMGLIKNADIPVPDIAVQKEYVRDVQAIRSHEELSRSSALHLDELFASLQSRAFRGEL